MLPEQAALAVAAGECYDALGDLVRARREYAAAVAIDPAMAAPRLRLDEIDRMESAARQMGSAMLQTDALRGWLATPGNVPEVAETAAEAHVVRHFLQSRDLRVEVPGHAPIRPGGDILAGDRQALAGKFLFLELDDHPVTSRPGHGDDLVELHGTAGLLLQ